jgi:hypothetical protein
MACRRLTQEGLLRREPGPRGKLVNFGINGSSQAVVTPRLSRLVKEANITEDEVKTALAKMLEATGWSVKVAWGRSRGIDIEATKAGTRWIIECKGTGSSHPMQNNYFIGVIGELLQRMHDDRAKHSIAFPDLPKYRRLWSELPIKVKHQLQLTALFVTNEGTIEELPQ